MIGKLLNAVVAASVIAAAGGAQEGQRPTRPQAQQKPLRDPPAERFRAGRQTVPDTTATTVPDTTATATTTTTSTSGETNGTDGRTVGTQARTEDGDQQDPEAVVFHFLAEHPDCLERIFARADTDGDGRLSPDERAAMREQLRARAVELQARRQDRRERRAENIADRNDALRERAEQRGRPAPQVPRTAPVLRQRQ